MRLYHRDLTLVKIVVFSSTIKINHRVESVNNFTKKINEIPIITVNCFCVARTDRLYFHKYALINNNTNSMVKLCLLF